MRVTSDPSPTGIGSAIVQWVKRVDVAFLGLHFAKVAHSWVSLVSVHMCTHTLLPKWAAVCVSSARTP